MDTVPDLGGLPDDELKKLIAQLTDEEQEVSYQRRILHGRIDILRAELVNRLRKKREDGESAISGADVQQLTDILSGKSMPGGEFDDPDPDAVDPDEADAEADANADADADKDSK